MAKNGVPLGGQFPELSSIEARLAQQTQTPWAAPLANDNSVYYNPAVPSDMDPYPSTIDDPNRLGPPPGVNEEPARFRDKSGKYTEVPTSTSFYPRPRTIAASYAPDRVNDKGVLTVIFRDGTLYNYYEVRLTEWELFHGQLSKGPMLNPASMNNPIAGFLMSKPRGEADISNTDPDVLDALRREARARQINRPNRRYNENAKAKGIVPTQPIKVTRRNTKKGVFYSSQGKNPWNSAVNRKLNP